MSFLVREDSPQLGAGTQVVLDNVLATGGTSSGLGPNIANFGKIQREEYITFPFAAATTSSTVFIADDKFQIVSMYFLFGTASASGTINVEVASDGTAVGSGTAATTGTVNLTGTANTKVQIPPATNIDSLQVAAGQHVNVLLAGTLTGLANAQLTIGLIRV